MNLYNSFVSFFLKHSKLDGRIVILFFLLLYFLSIYCSSFFMDYAEFWQLLGVPSGKILFSDLYWVAKAIKCPEVNYNLYPNPCNPIFSYPKIWYFLSSIWVSPQNNTYLAIFIIILYYYIIFIFTGNIDRYSGLYYALLLCSPPMMLAVERCQPDLIIFILCGLAIWLNKKEYSVFWSSSLLILAGILKLYPFATIISYLNNNRKSSIRLTFILMIIATFYVLINLENILIISHSLTKYYWSISVGFLHGCMVFLNLLNTYSIFHNIFNYIPLQFLAYSIVLLLLITLFYLSKKQAISQYNTDHLFAFRVGASLYVGSFIIGSNYDYKFIMFIFTIPQLIAWLKNNSVVRKCTLVALSAILITCWSFLLFQKFYWIVYTFIEESLNWYIFGYFIFMLLNTFPEWTKKYLWINYEHTNHDTNGKPNKTSTAETV